MAGSRACNVGSPGCLLWAVFGWQALEGVGGGAEDNAWPCDSCQWPVDPYYSTSIYAGTYSLGMGRLGRGYGSTHSICGILGLGVGISLVVEGGVPSHIPLLGE